MTPEERAKEITLSVISIWRSEAAAKTVMADYIASAIRAAEEDEREACAKVAEHTCPSSDLEEQAFIQRHIAAAIRARSKQ